MLSDSNITPLLTMLGAAEMASRRPVWGSTLVFELSAPLLPCPVCLRRRCMHLIFSSECVEFCAACLAVLKAASVSRAAALTAAPRRLQGPKRWQLAVRVIFAGKVLQLGGECGGKALCDWADWRSFLEGMVPSRDECPEFYAAWPPPPGG